jgi:hypothetical protein
MRVGPWIPVRYSYKRLVLAQLQLLGQLGIFLTCGPSLEVTGPPLLLQSCSTSPLRHT